MPRHTPIPRALSVLFLLLALSLSTVALHAQSRAVITKPASAAEPATTESATATDPLGEWYLVGHRMGEDAMPTFREFQLKNATISRRLPEVLAALGVQATSLKASQLRLLQQGWDDAILGKAPALSYPPDQLKSLLPPELRGYHKFQSSPGPADAPGATLADKAALWKKAVVKVVVDHADSIGHGSGCFIGPGLIITNNHVIDGALADPKSVLSIQLEADATVHPATVIARQKIPDIALLRVDLKDHEILPIGRSADCRELEEVIMIGYPLHVERSATYVKGAISALNRTVNGCEVLQLDIRANPGNSGGPVINTRGQVVGILTSGDQAVEFTQFIYAQKTDFIRPFLEKHARGLYQTAE